MKNIQVLLTTILLTTVVATSISQVRLPRLISDGLVLQRHTKIPVWGWASPNERVRIVFAGQQYETTASPGGSWRIELPEMEAGGPYNMTISGKNDILLEDIMIGDVWLCAGQSNMVHQLNIHDVTYAEDIITANNPAIRHFKVPARPQLNGPAEDLSGGSWQPAIAERVRPFSAVAYFFARQLYGQYQVPIGLINASVGGTPIEAWIGEEGFRAFPEILQTIGQNKDTVYVNGRRMAWADAQKQARTEPHDQGLAGPEPWFAVSYQPKNWRRINIPGYWEDQGAKGLNGVVWYRREIELPATMAGNPATVFLGRIVDADQLYINGEQVGKTTYQYPQRRYKVPAGLLKAGKNVFVIRVTNNSGKGGFVPDKPYCIFTGQDTVDLKGYWYYKVGEVFMPRSPTASRPRRFSPQNEPTSLYNGMVAPYSGFPLKGVLWYQGESNAGRPAAYADLLPALIEDWRGRFKAADLPFIYAQLPNFMDVAYWPSESNWAELRESQLKALKVPNTAMTVNIDLGEWNDIHPDNKKDVGERMALAARKIAYGEDIVCMGPLYESHRIEGNEVIISFSQTGSGLVTNDGEAPGEFAIAGEDQKFIWAQARIEGNKVIVWSERVAVPKYVRYAWADNPDNPNLYNKEGLPASPFRISH